MKTALMPYGDDDRRRRTSKALVQQANAITDEVRLAGLMADGAIALGAHIMESTVGLDDHRRSLAGGDAAMNALLMDLEADTVRQVKKIKNRLFDKFDL